MNKATETSLDAMSRDQLREDISMTALQRLGLACQISDFALSIHRDRQTSKEESPSIQWIELHKVSTPNERNTR